MIKLVYCIRRRADRSREEFHRYWRNEHATLARSFHSTLRLQRYVQSHRLESEINAALAGGIRMEEPYDGIAEIWWRSLEDFRAVLADPEGRRALRALREDELRFIDLEASRLFLTEEHVVVDPNHET